MGFKHSILLPWAVMFLARSGDSKGKQLVMLSFPRVRSSHTFTAALQPCVSDGQALQHITSQGLPASAARV